MLRCCAVARMSLYSPSGRWFLVALGAAELLAAQGIAAAVVNARFVKPLDADCLYRVAQRAALVVTLEENITLGGFGTSVCELLATAGLIVPVLSLGIPDIILGQGPRDILLARLGLTPEAVRQTVLTASAHRDAGRPVPPPGAVRRVSAARPGAAAAQGTKKIELTPRGCQCVLTGYTRCV